MRKVRGLALLGVLALLVTAGCAGGPLSTRERMTYGGGALGAATGAIIGAATGSAAVGAAIGGPVGLIGGYLIGDSIQASEASTCYRSSAPARSSYQVRSYSRKGSRASQSKSSPSTSSSSSAGEVF